MEELLGPKSAAAELSRAYPRFKTSHVFYKYSYGTAGFRDKAEVLPSAFARVGMLAALQSKKFDGKVVGVVVTASHNLSHDNGAKIMDWQGEMLAQSWEQFATDLANADEGQGVSKVLTKFAEAEKIDITAPARVFVGRDTRKSSPHLHNLVMSGVEALGGDAFDHGQVTTPQLHWIVREFNKSPQLFSQLGESGSDRHEDVEVYNSHLAAAFKEVVGSRKLKPLIVDCANGIGSVALESISQHFKDVLPITRINTDIETFEALNMGVGAEHVQKNRKLPGGVDPQKDQKKKFASMDGDADRVVFFFVDEKAQMRLLDGDKIIALTGGYLGQLVQDAGLSDEVTIGVVQTAYANGASSAYLRQKLGLPVECVPTGVKHLHHKAAEFSIGIYFEANGHGTILFSEDALHKFKAAAADVSSPSSKEAIATRKLLALARLVNQAVGDAISDILLVEAVLNDDSPSESRIATFRQWDAMYTDFPSHQAKVKVKDRSVVKTADAERRVVAPASLQPAIDAAVKTVGGPPARAFVRPSGTEDVVRTYAEATSLELAEKLGGLVADAVKKHAGGI